MCHAWEVSHIHEACISQPASTAHHSSSHEDYTPPGIPYTRHLRRSWGQITLSVLDILHSTHPHLIHPTSSSLRHLILGSRLHFAIPLVRRVARQLVQFLRVAGGLAVIERRRGALLVGVVRRRRAALGRVLGLRRRGLATLLSGHVC